MNQKFQAKMLLAFRVTGIAFLLVFAGMTLVSFKAEKMYADVFAKLGITKEQGNERISSGLLGGYLNYYGMRNLKNIVMNDRAAIIKDIAGYAKQYSASEAFKKEYFQMKEREKPTPIDKPQTPEEMRAGMIKNAKEAVASMEKLVKESSGSMKTAFEKSLADAKENQKRVEDPNNKNQKAYTQNYPQSVKYFEQANIDNLARWEAKYPANYLLYVKKNLQAFLDATKDIDFSAELTERGGKKYFVKKEYEYKGNQWKAAFRCGKEPVEAARAFAQQWISEIK
jgi:hypothetical protein